MSTNILDKYGHLIANYCISTQPGDRVLIQTTTLAEPLVRPLYREIINAGGIPHVQMQFRDQDLIRINNGNDDQLAHVDPLYQMAVEQFDGYVFIRAPFYSKNTQEVNYDNAKKAAKANKPTRDLYYKRTASLSLKRTLCEFPTIANAQNAGLSLEEYSHHIYNACYLFEDNPAECWKALSVDQQRIVDHLNKCKHIHYKGEDIDVQFSTQDRIWINSDGKTNMPSGEVYTAPVEDSVNGTIHFSYPSIFRGEEVEGITLWVKDGWIEKWEAKKGRKLLDRIFSIDEGARRFGEAAIGTNHRIKRPLKNILFDEKIGGTVHMAVGQAYIQNNGKNTSSIHWDMIADMTSGGAIFADGEKIYQNGRFLI